MSASILKLLGAGVAGCALSFTLVACGDPGSSTVNDTAMEESATADDATTGTGDDMSADDTSSMEYGNEDGYTGSEGDTDADTTKDVDQVAAQDGDAENAETTAQP